MLNLLARMKLYFKEVFSNSINLFRNKKKELKLYPQLQSSICIFRTINDCSRFAFHNLKSPMRRKKKKKKKVHFAF